MTLGGTLIVKDAIRFDYCVTEAVLSLLRVCDKVVVVDGYSSDGTFEMLHSMLKTSPKLSLVRHAWTPSPMGQWLADLTNVARSYLKTRMHLNVQADEVLHEADYPLIRQLADTGGTYTLERLNFWHDPQHMLPPEEKVGTHIVRLAPSDLLSVGDAQSLDPRQSFKRSKVRIYHYGFIRKPLAWAAKSREMMAHWGWGIDPTVEAVERGEMGALGDPKYATAVPLNRLVPYSGTHPKVAHEWLRERGYSV